MCARMYSESASATPFPINVRHFQRCHFRSLLPSLQNVSLVSKVFVYNSATKQVFKSILFLCNILCKQFSYSGLPLTRFFLKEEAVYCGNEMLWGERSLQFGIYDLVQNIASFSVYGSSTLREMTCSRYSLLFYFTSLCFAFFFFSWLNVLRLFQVVRILLGPQITMLSSHFPWLRGKTVFHFWDLSTTENSQNLPSYFRVEKWTLSMTVMFSLCIFQFCVLDSASIDSLDSV